MPWGLPQTLEHALSLALKHQDTEGKGREYVADGRQGAGFDTQLDQGEQLQPGQEHDEQSHRIPLPRKYGVVVGDCKAPPAGFVRADRSHAAG
jgi:hypothetical protein